jgi:hypothetical protein
VRCLALAGPAGFPDQPPQHDQNENPAAHGQQGRPPRYQKRQNHVDDGFDHHGGHFGAEMKGRGCAMGLKGDAVGELTDRLADKILPAGSEQRPEQAQAHFGRDQRHGVSDLFVRQVNNDALEDDAADKEGQQGRYGRAGAR